MFTTIITDCYEGNEAGRQITRFNSLGLGPTTLIGVGSDFSEDATIEGGVNLIDIIDASEGKEGVIVLNVAPRGNKKEGENGNPFAYFYYKETLVISSIKDHCLSFVKKFGITNRINLLELSVALKFAESNNLIGKSLVRYIRDTQFRSFDFVPRVARWLINGISIPSKPLSLASHFSLPKPCVWCVDAFGNAKTTLIPKEVELEHGKKVKTNYGEFKYYNRLKDVPFGETAIYTGSSGFGDKRFLELTVQGVPGSVAEKLNVKLGSPVIIF